MNGTSAAVPEVLPGLARTTYDTWCDVLGLEAVPCSPLERAARVPRWMAAELVATVPAQRKLHAWCARTPRDQWHEPGAPASVLVAVHAIGDEVLLHALARVLCRLPAPARDYALTRVTYLLVGVETVGWCGPVPDLGGRPFVIVLSADARDADAFENVAAHEVSHAWLEPEPCGVTCASAFRLAVVHHTPMADVPDGARVAVLAERRRAVEAERVACALARRWGFSDV